MAIEVRPGQKSPRGLTVEQRMLLRSRLDSSGCRLWWGALDNGYGAITITSPNGAGRKLVHRVAYETWIGPIPEGLTVDHMCFQRACINPEHLRLLPHNINAALQRRALASHCQRGHEFSSENTGRKGDGTRYCKACSRWRGARRTKKAIHGLAERVAADKAVA